MARTKTDREDLMTDAVAFVRRIEFTVPAQESRVVCGIRRDGAFSIYAGQDSVFHFDRNCRLRRAFRNGRLYRTQGDTLAELTRERGESTTLVRNDLSPTLLAEFLRDMRQTLQALRAALADGSAVVRRQVPEDDGELAGDVGGVLDRILRNESALAPAIAGKS
jgi:hypothetical protein